MKSEEIAVLPEIAQRIVDLQVEHNLPIEIIVGEMTDSLQKVILEYEFKEDYHLYAWMLNRAINSFLREQGITDDDLEEEDDDE